jgi:hypothetical protein
MDTFRGAGRGKTANHRNGGALWHAVGATGPPEGWESVQVGNMRYSDTDHSQT